MQTLSKAALAARGGLVPDYVIDQGLEAMGARATDSLERESRESRALLVSQFVRRLRGASVQRINDLERLLLVELRAAPEGVQDMLLKDAISVIRARNHIGQIGKSLGLQWAECMRIESALSDLLLQAAGSGRGLLQTTVHAPSAIIVIKLPSESCDGKMLTSLPSTYEVHERLESDRVHVFEVSISAMPRAGAA